MRMTQAEWLAYEARRHKPAVNSDGVDDESDLHNEIIRHCKDRGWIYFHGSMATKTHRTKGEPDFTIWADAGRKYAFECKSKAGKLSTDQLALIAQAEKLGHTIHVISSYEQFIARL